MSTCGNMTIAYLLCNVFICLTSLIILNLLLAVLLESLQDHQDKVASSNQNGTQDGGSVSRLMNISRAASSWRRGSADIGLAKHDDEDDDAPKFVGVNPLSRVQQDNPQRSSLSSLLAREWQSSKMASSEAEGEVSQDSPAGEDIPSGRRRRRSTIAQRFPSPTVHNQPH